MIWEACRATSAAPSFFDPVRIGPYDQEFVDGGLLYNNPIHLLYREAASSWPNQVSSAVFVSIGTGSAPGGTFEGNLKNIVDALKDIVTQTERTAEDFAHGHSDIVRRNSYFRFQVFHGLADVGLEEYQLKGQIADAAQGYLDLAETKTKSRLCIDRLCTADAGMQ